MNAEDFQPENEWVEKDSRIKDVNPCLQPSTHYSESGACLFWQEALYNMLNNLVRHNTN
jgi:hypothetical protein